MSEYVYSDIIIRIFYGDLTGNLFCTTNIISFGNEYDIARFISLCLEVIMKSFLLTIHFRDQDCFSTAGDT